MKYLIGGVIGLIVAVAVMHTRASAASICTVSVGMGELSASSQCFMNQVMTGTQVIGSSNYIYCSEIQVNCN